VKCRLAAAISTQRKDVKERQMLNGRFGGGPCAERKVKRKVEQHGSGAAICRAHSTSCFWWQVSWHVQPIDSAVVWQTVTCSHSGARSAWRQPSCIHHADGPPLSSRVTERELGLPTEALAEVPAADLAVNRPSWRNGAPSSRCPWHRCARARPSRSQPSSSPPAPRPPPSSPRREG